jgi:pimeloyl-ACP methyl ester carboxylesterase
MMGDMTETNDYLETAGARIHYRVEGTGPAVVLIHAGVADLTMWDADTLALRDRFRVIRYDTRGFGLTRTEAVPFSNRADIAALLDHLDEPRAHVVGLSRGGAIALDFALEYPQRVRTLTVVAGGVTGYDSPLEDASMWAEVEAMYEAKDWRRIADWETAYWADGPGQSPDRVPAIHARVHAWVLANLQAELEVGRPQPLDPPAEARLSDLRAPLLVILGTLDDPATSDSMRHLAASVAGARLIELEAAHMVNLEHPARFQGLLLEHLAAG